MVQVLNVFVWLWLLVAVHELGHFSVAYWFKQPIARVTVGNGLTLRQWQWKGINFCCKLLPFSGGVLLVYRSRTKWKNLLIIVAGSVANLLAAVFLWFLDFEDGASLSLYLGAYNLLPFWELDGKMFLDEWNRIRPVKILL